MWTDKRELTTEVSSEKQPSNALTYVAAGVIAGLVAGIVLKEGGK